MRLWEVVQESLRALDWQSHGYFYTFMEGNKAWGECPNGTLVMCNEYGTFLADEAFRPILRKECNRVLRMDKPNAQLLAHYMQKELRTSLVITQEDELWMIPIVMGFGLRYFLHPSLYGVVDTTAFVQGGEVFRFFFISLYQYQSVAVFKRLTMAQQQMILFLYFNRGREFNSDPEDRYRCDPEMWEYFRGIEFVHIFEAFNDYYYVNLKSVINYYRSKDGHRKAYAAFFHNKLKDEVPQSPFRKMIGHGATRYPIYKRVCYFLYKHSEIADPNST